MLVVTKTISGALEQVRAAVAAAGPNTQPLISAVSGGPDSLALSLLIEEIAKAQNRHHYAVIVNHGLRSEAEDEARAAASMLAKYGIESEILRVTAPKPHGNLQEYARKHRLSLLAAAGRSSGAIVCFGHHKQDQAETIYMRLSKGSGLQGLSGMPQMRMHEGCLFLRPLLDVTPDILSDICHAKGITPIQDPSNSDRRFERVRVRQHLETSPQLAKHLLRLGSAAAKISTVLDDELCKAITGHIIWQQPYSGSVTVDCFRRLPALLRQRLLTLMLQDIGKGDYPAAQDAIMRLDTKLMAGASATLAGCMITINGQYITFAREARHLPEMVTLNDTPAGVIFDKSWHISGLPGLQFAPIGESRYASLSKRSPLRQFLARWPYHARLRFPVLAPLDVNSPAHHFKEMDKWVEAPASVRELFELNLPLADNRSISSW